MSFIRKNKLKLITLGIGTLLLVLLIFTFFTSGLSTALFPSIKAQNLMKNIPHNKVTGIETDDTFITAAADFSIGLLQNTFTDTDSILISPASAMLPLAMTANGANGETCSQMTQVLAKDIPLNTLNQYLYSFRKSLKSTSKSKLHINNSIWINEGHKLQANFLRTNADYYNASIYQAPFNDQTLKDINHWIKWNTNGHIHDGLETINPDSMLYLINTLTFDSKWKSKYKKEDIIDDTFHNQNGSDTHCKFMCSDEEYYLTDGKATGFIKPYYNDHYRFVALLPNEGITLSDYIHQMTGEQFIHTLKAAKPSLVSTQTPEFHYDYSLSLINALNKLGMKDATSYTAADFSGIDASAGHSFYIGNVIQKSYINVNPNGTKAGSMTSVQVDSCPPEPDKRVNLNRPFLYAIIDTKTNLPIFMGVITDINKLTQP